MRRFWAVLFVVVMLGGTAMGQELYGQNMAKWKLGSYDVTVYGNVSQVEGVQKWVESRDGEETNANGTKLLIDGARYALFFSETFDGKPLKEEKSSRLFNTKITVNGYNGITNYVNDTNFPCAIFVINISDTAELKVFADDWGNYHSQKGIEHFQSKVRTVINGMKITLG